MYDFGPFEWLFLILFSVIVLALVVDDHPPRGK